MTLYQDSEDRASIESAVETAMKDHRRIDNSVNLSAQKLLEVCDIETPVASTVVILTFMSRNHDPGFTGSAETSLRKRQSTRTGPLNWVNKAQTGL